LITMRLIDVKQEVIEKTQVLEFLNIPQEISSMINISVRKMFGRQNDNNLLLKLTKRYDYESLANNPTEEQLKLSGSRMGFTVLTGETAKILAAPRSEGGYGVGFPVMFQFGYQFEKQYLNAGQVQALFEFIPMITGLDHGMFIPSLTVMNGVRDNHHGWEFAFGPTVNVITTANGYYSSDGTWHLESDWINTSVKNPYTIETRIDNRGQATLNWGFVLAVGRTYKSGRLNIPLNFYVIPNNNGVQFGASFGFNSKYK
jgi:hypothetical protein